MDIEYSNNLNDDWINNFEKNDKLYQDFYKDDLYYVNLKLIYVNRNNEIDKVKQESFLMSIPNYISREEILELLKRCSIDENRRYTLLSILQYNITLDTDDIKKFLYNNNSELYLTKIKHIDSIKFNKTISILQDLNEVIFLFYEKSNEVKKKNLNSCTKKIVLHSNTKKKTIRIRYKD
jgi:hypothetical protein